MSRFSACVGPVSRGLAVGAAWKVEEQCPENLELQEKGLVPMETANNCWKTGDVNGVTSAHRAVTGTCLLTQ